MLCKRMPLLLRAEFNRLAAVHRQVELAVGDAIDVLVLRVIEPPDDADLEKLKAALRPDTILVSVMYVNNEIGVINPIAEIGKIAKEHGIFFAVDGVQAVGKIPVDVLKDNMSKMKKIISEAGIKP